MIALGLALAAALLVVAFVHAYWGLGGVWPAASPQSLARSVVGERGITKMPPPTASLLVAAALAGMAYLALIKAGVAIDPAPPGISTLAATIVAFIFLMRGLASYTPIMRRFFPEEPFATLDRRYYAPLCLAFGITFVILQFKGMS